MRQIVEELTEKTLGVVQVVKSLLLTALVLTTVAGILIPAYSDDYSSRQAILAIVFLPYATWIGATEAYDWLN